MNDRHEITNSNYSSISYWLNSVRRRSIISKGLLAATFFMAFTSSPILAQEYAPYPLDGPPYGSTYFPYDYNLPGGRVRPGIPPPAPMPYWGEFPEPRRVTPESEARRMVCPPGSCGPWDDDE